MSDITDNNNCLFWFAKQTMPVHNTLIVISNTVGSGCFLFDLVHLRHVLTCGTCYNLELINIIASHMLTQCLE